MATVVLIIHGTGTDDPGMGLVPNANGYRRHNQDYLQEAMQEAMQGVKKDGPTI